ncbi:response regulator [Sphingomonas daechungensis]|uniref:response regulator n=1 Tax=Sphingomonas daechungensis TaxID=1176646 RepID=UPI001A485484|nr:response regulator [Rhodospirillales bacterium]
MTQERYAKLGALVVDDQAVVRAMLLKMLEQLGFGFVEAASDGSAALDTIRSADRLPSVIVCDIAMKPMDGLAFLAELRALPEIHRARIPVILLTATATGELALRARELRANGYIVKPVTPEVLALRVERAISAS